MRRFYQVMPDGRNEGRIMAGMVHLRQAQFTGANNHLDLCRTLMREYAAFLNASVGGEHICIEGLEKELAALPGEYAEPRGTVLLAFDEDEPAGCVALKPLQLPHPGHEEERACEMKRLWVRPALQGRKIGRKLADAVVDAARRRGYSCMYLDTMPQSMQAAYALYVAMGFSPVSRYNQNPVLRQTENLEIAFLRKEL
jgi:putative acetyltransferase